MQKNNEINKGTFIHNQYQTELRNGSPKILFTTEQVNYFPRLNMLILQIKNYEEDQKVNALILKLNIFIMRDRIEDLKHPDCNKFEEVRTKVTMIHKNTHAIFKNTDDKQAKPIEGSLLVANDLVAAEAKNHISCRVRVNFEKHVPQNKTPSYSVSTEK